MKRHARNSLMVVALLFMIGSSFAEPPTHQFVPKDGFVPNAETAIRIAVAVWEPIYGADNIERQKPYRAQLVNGVWRVDGSLPPNTIGGTAHAEISQMDGRILSVLHTR